MSRGAPSYGATTPPTPLNDAPQGGYFLAKTPYAKPVKTLDQQIALLRDRGLVVADDAIARLHLENINYFRLSGYSRYFAAPDDPKVERFRPDTSFDDLIALYVFDRRMRALLLEALERIEVSIKGSIAYHGSIHAGPFWLIDPVNFDHGAHHEIMALVDAACVPPDGRHKQMYMEHFYTKYSDPYPPAWVITEVLSFHGASIIYKRMKGIIRRPVADRFQVQHDILENWLHALVFVRNLCAHHSRVWNRSFTIWPQIPKQYRAAWPAAAQNRLYVCAGIIKHMLDRIGGDPTWPDRLRQLVNDRPPKATLQAMSFPDDWEAQPFWGFNVGA